MHSNRSTKNTQIKSYQKRSDQSKFPYNSHHIIAVTSSGDHKVVEWRPTMVPLKDFDRKMANKQLKDYCKANSMDYKDLVDHMR